MTAHTVLIRDVKTLDVLGEIPHYIDLTWTRKDVDAGHFALTIHRDVVDQSLLERNLLLEVLRDSTFEFAGVIRRRRINSVSNIWTLAGPDLKGFFLGRRNVAISAEDAQNGVIAETALKHYVDANGGPGAAAARRFATELDTATWAIEADQARGGSVDFTVIRKNLLKGALIPVARSGDVIHDIILLADRSGYEYQVSLPTDATVASGAVPFSVSWDNVSELIYDEDMEDLRNAISVLGAGSGGSRTIREVTDAASIVEDFRSEGFTDARDATTNDQLDLVGQTEIADRIRESISTNAQPLQQGPSEYRTDWDVGWDVTIAIAELGISIDRRVVEAQISVSARDEENIRIRVGRSPRTLGKKLEGLLQRGLVAQNE